MQNSMPHDLQSQPTFQNPGQAQAPSYMNGRVKSETGSDRGGSPHSNEAPRYPGPPQPPPVNAYPPLPSYGTDLRYPSPGATSIGVAAPLLNAYNTAPNDPNPYATQRPLPEAQQQQRLTNDSSGPVKNFACSTCGKGFARRSDLARHERIHSGIRPHICDWPNCGKQFIQRSALTVHTRVHTGEKPHMCEHCGKPFSDSSSLARHRRIHSGKRPYKCPYADCQKTFTRRTTLTRHQNHHTGTVEEAAVATAAALASRASVVSRSTRSEADEFSPHHSPIGTPTPNDRGMSMSPSAGLNGMPSTLHRAGSDLTYGMPIPGHMRNELQPSPRSSPSLTSQPYMNAVQSQRGPMTSHPAAYGPPPVLEPSPQNGQSNSGHGSPHMGVGWQSPSHQAMGSPNPGDGYVYPEPQYNTAQPNIYYQNNALRRTNSSEPDHYDPRQPTQMWTQTVQ